MALLPAKDAREQTDEYVRKGVTENSKLVSECINDAIARGEYSCQFSGTLIFSVKNYLRDLGYDVTYYPAESQRETSYYIITW